jgi:hypothetical protein
METHVPVHALRSNTKDQFDPERDVRANAHDHFESESDERSTREHRAAPVEAVQSNPKKHFDRESMLRSTTDPRQNRTRRPALTTWFATDAARSAHSR